jgi:RNA 2',3'-cyclic 3'-phosphodiesterase
MRLFIAIDLDDAARAAIAAEQKRIAGALRDASRSSLKWVRPEHMHLTLVFLGEVADAQVQDVVAAVGEPIDRAPFAVAFGGIGVFPPRGRPNVLWIGVTDGREAIDAVQRALQARVEHLGLAVERRPFHPHLTLARWRDSRERDRTHVAEAAVDRTTARIRVDHATLYHSRLGPQGATYTELARGTLTA